MPLPRPLGLLLLLWLLAHGFAGRAEFICPRLAPARAASFRQQLRRSRPDTSRVRLLLLLGQDLVTRYEEDGKPLGPAPAYARQAAALSQRLHFDAGRIGSLYLLGQLHLYAGQDTLGRSLLRQGLALSRRTGHRRLEGFGWLWLGEVQPPAGRLAYFERARALFGAARDRAAEAYVLKTIADTHQTQGHPQQAIRELLEAEALYRAAGQRRLLYTYDLLAAVYRNLGDYREALRYGTAALENARAVQDTAIIGALYVRLAIVYRELKQYPAALQYYHKALTTFERSGDALNAVTTAGGIVRVMVTQHRAAEALAFFTQTTRPYASDEPRVVERIADYMVELHCALRHYPQAEPYARQLVAFLGTGTADAGERTAVYLTLGQFYTLTRRYDEARRYLQRALELHRRDGAPLYLAQVHRLLFEADSAQRRFPAAIAHYQRYKLLTDSVFNEKKNQQLASLQMQYDTRSKEQNIALLTRQTQAQRARLRQREFQRNAVVVGALLLVGLLGLGYNRYRLKQRATRLLEAQQTEINQQNQSLQQLLREKDWMLKEIHHRVKNNLEVISSLLETQADYLHDPAALGALRESQNRVHAMALIHQKLYQSESLSLVNMADYIREISEHLLESFNRQGTVAMQLAVAPVELEVTLATPLGLIINELLTNALKYAFPYRQPGRVRVELAETGPQHYRLLIADNGVGFPPGFDPEENHTMGLTIVHGLSGQLDGTLQIVEEAGVRVSLEFEAG